MRRTRFRATRHHLGCRDINDMRLGWLRRRGGGADARWVRRRGSGITACTSSALKFTLILDTLGCKIFPTTNFRLLCIYSERDQNDVDRHRNLTGPFSCTGADMSWLKATTQSVIKNITLVDWQNLASRRRAADPLATPNFVSGNPGARATFAFETHRSKYLLRPQH